MQSSRVATAFNVASAIVTLVVQMGISFVLSSYLVATVGETATGFSQLANNFVSYASLITLAFNSMGARFIASSYHRGNASEAGSYYSTLVVCNVVLCLLFLPAAVTVISNIQDIVDLGNANLHDVQLLFAFVFINFAVNLFVSLFCSAMFVTNKLYIQNSINLCRNVLNALFLLFAYTIFEAQIHYVSLIALLLSLISIPVCYYYKRRLVPELTFSPARYSFSFVKKLTSSGVWNTINQAGNVLTTGLDLLFANWFVGAAPMGTLSIAKTVPNALITLASTLNGNLEPELVISYAREGDSGLLRRLWTDIKLSNLILSVPIAVFCCLAPAFYCLWMPSLNASQLSALSFLSLLAYIPWAGLQTLYNVFTATNRLKVNSIAFATGSVMNIIVVLFLLEFTDLGLYAIAGTSSVISIVRNGVITIPYISTILATSRRRFYWEAFKSTFCCIASWLVTAEVARLLVPSNWLALLIAAFISCIIGWALIAMLTFSKGERQRVLSIITRRIKKADKEL